MKQRGIDPGPNSIPGPGSGRTHLLAQEYEPHNSRTLLVPGGHYLAPDWRPAVACIPWLDEIPTTPLITNGLVRCGRCYHSRGVVGLPLRIKKPAIWQT